MSDTDRLNPQITTTDVGVRNLRKIKIYPLALGAEIKLTETLSSSITEYFTKMKSVEGMSDVAVAGFVVDLVKKNFQYIVGLVVDDDVNVEDLLGDITNYQVAGIAEIIYQRNFEEAEKNAPGLSGKVRKLFLSDGPSQPFASSMDTVILDSSVQTTPTEDSPEGS